MCGPEALSHVMIVALESRQRIDVPPPLPPATRVGDARRHFECSLWFGIYGLMLLGSARRVPEQLELVWQFSASAVDSFAISAHGQLRVGSPSIKWFWHYWAEFQKMKLWDVVLRESYAAPTPNATGSKSGSSRGDFGRPASWKFCQRHQQLPHDQPVNSSVRSLRHMGELTAAPTPSAKEECDEHVDDHAMNRYV